MTANLIAEVAPYQGQVIAGTDTGTEVHVQTHAGVTTVPLDPKEPIALHDSAGETPALEVSLPVEIKAKEGAVATDGTVVYQSIDVGRCAALG